MYLLVLAVILTDFLTIFSNFQYHLYQIIKRKTSATNVGIEGII